MKKIGRYEVVEELGRGAMGVVYKAADPTIDRMVAIKVLVLSRPAQAGLPGAKDIFLREARAAGRLSHPGIVTIHDALEDSELKSCYIVMEFVEGHTLEKALLTGPPFPVESAFKVARQIGEALEYAHKQKIIHRDLKPANILLTEDGRAKITDFGIAKVIATEDAHRTLAIMGTPSYMSPEQVMGGELDASSDIFSLGILLYLMLTGEKPFSGDTAAVMFKIAYQDPAPPSQIRTELGKGHDFLLLRALAKDKSKRYANARELLDDLDDLEHNRPPRSEAKIPLAELHSGDLTVRASKPLVPMQTAAPVAAPKHSITLRPAIYIPALAVVLIAGIWAFMHKSAPPVPVSQSQATSPASTPPQTTAAPPVSASGTPASSATERPSAPPPKTEAAKAAPSPNIKKPASTSTASAGKPALVQTGAAPAAVPPPSANTAAESAAKPKPSETTGAQNAIQISCQFDLEEATMTISGGGHNLLNATLAGKREGRLLGLKHRFSGAYSQPLKVPSDLHSLTVHIESGKGSTNLTRTINMPAADGKDHTLHVFVTSNKLQLSW